MLNVFIQTPDGLTVMSYPAKGKIIFNKKAKQIVQNLGANFKDFSIHGKPIFDLSETVTAALQGTATGGKIVMQCLTREQLPTVVAIHHTAPNGNNGGGSMLFNPLSFDTTPPNPGTI